MEALPNASASALRGDATARSGLHALDNERFNTLCLPEAARLTDAEARAVYAEAIRCADERRAMLLIDPGTGVTDAASMRAWAAASQGLRHANAAAYFPRVALANPSEGGTTLEIGASGAIAGLFARWDRARGVWKAAGGADARVLGVGELAASVTASESEALNRQGVNVIRDLPPHGFVSWGVRTLAGADGMASEFKYIPVRRLALYVEQSLAHGFAWAVNEPNAEPLWKRVRASVNAFLHELFRKGAFHGNVPKDGYYVRCGPDTMTQDDIDNGRLIGQIGIAPLKPAEFVIFRFGQSVRQPPKP